MAGRGASHSADRLVTRVVELVRGGSHDAAVRLIESSWDALATTAPARMLAAIGELPASVLLTRRHLYLASIELQRLALDLSDADPVLSHPGAPTASTVDQLAVHTASIIHHHANGDDARAAQLIERARRLSDRATGGELLELHHRLPELKLYWALCGSDSERLSELESSYELALGTDQLTLARRAAGEIAWAHAAAGWSSNADRWIARATGLPPGHVQHEEPLLLARAIRAADGLDYAGAGHIAAGIRSNQRRIRGPLLWVRAVCASTRREAALVEADLGAIPEETIGTGRAARGDADYRMAARVELALRWRPHTTRSLAEHADRLGGVFAGIVLSRVLRPAQALATLRNLEWDSLSPRCRSAALLATSAAHLANGETDAATDAFLDAHAVIEDGQLLHSYRMLTPSSLDALCRLTGVRLDPRVADTPASAGATERLVHLASLSHRQRQVLALIGADYSVTQIAAELFISTNTVKTTMRHLYARLGIHSRAEATQIAQQIGVA